MSSVVGDRRADVGNMDTAAGGWVCCGKWCPLGLIVQKWLARPGMRNAEQLQLLARQSAPCQFADNYCTELALSYLWQQVGCLIC